MWNYEERWQDSYVGATTIRHDSYREIIIRKITADNIFSHINWSGKSHFLAEFLCVGFLKSITRQPLQCSFPPIKI